MKKLVFLAGFFIFSPVLISQVGIGTITPDPSSLLEVSSIDKGILIPQVSLNDVANTMIDGVNTAATGLLIYNTNAATTGGSGVGYYYFNGSTWERLSTSLSGGDDDWYEVGTTTAPNDIDDDVYTQGNVAIGKTTADYRLEINELGGTATRTLNIFSNYSDPLINTNIYNENNFTGVGTTRGLYNLMGGTGDGVVMALYNNIQNTGVGLHYGIYNGLSGSGSGEQRAIYNSISNSGNNSHYGVLNVLTGNGTGIHYGVSNQIGGTGDGQIRGYENIITNSGDGIQYGAYTFLSGGGTGLQYGTYSTLSGSGSGGHYGVYSRLSGTGTGNQTGVYSEISNSGDNVHYGFNANLSGNGNGVHYGFNNSVTGGGTGIHYGLYNTMGGSGSGDQYAMRSIISNSGGGNHFGNYLGLSGSGSGNKYGSFIIINNAAGGTHYGVYSQALKTGSYAGYFLGSLAVGTSGANIYTLPASRGTANQIMQTNGAGVVSWIDPSAIDDGDWVDNGADIERQTGNVYIGDTNATNNNLYISNLIIDWDNSSYYLDPASNNSVNEIQFDDGSAADPSLYFNGDTTTGFFSPATDEIAFSINSSEVLRIDSSGNLGVGTPSPSASLDVEGTFKLGTDGNSHSGMYSLNWNFGTTSIPANSSVVLTITGTNTVLNIPQQTGVSVAFESDIGASVLVQHIWMDADAINIRLSNISASLVSFPTVANILFVWQ